MSQTLQHKGYDGSVLYSADDCLLHGRILGIRDLVSFEGTDVESLENNFKAAVDKYLALCEAEGKAPDTPFEGSFNVRISQIMHQRAPALPRSTTVNSTPSSTTPCRSTSPNPHKPSGSGSSALRFAR